jgi:transposase
VSEEEKALKRHLVEKVPVSTICEELQIAPNLFYTWQQRLFEGAGSVLSELRRKKGQDVIVTTCSYRLVLSDRRAMKIH